MTAEFGTWALIPVGAGHVLELRDDNGNRIARSAISSDLRGILFGSSARILSKAEARVVFRGQNADGFPEVLDVPVQGVDVAELPVNDLFRLSDGEQPIDLSFDALAVSHELPSVGEAGTDIPVTPTPTVGEPADTSGSSVPDAVDGSAAAANPAAAHIINEHDIRKIVRLELERAALRRSRQFAEQMYQSATEETDPAAPGSLLEQIRSLRLDAAQKGLDAVLLRELNRDLLESIPEPIQLSGEVPLVEPVVVTDQTSAVRGATPDTADLLDDVVHENSSWVEAEGARYTSATDPTVEDPADSASTPLGAVGGSILEVVDHGDGYGHLVIDGRIQAWHVQIRGRA